MPLASIKIRRVKIISSAFLETDDIDHAYWNVSLLRDSTTTIKSMLNAGKSLSHIFRRLGMRLGRPSATPGDEANLSVDRFYFTTPISLRSVPRISVLVRSASFRVLV